MSALLSVTSRSGHCHVRPVKGLKSAGVDILAYGLNSPETDRRAPYDFFCVYRVPNVEFQRV